MKKVLEKLGAFKEHEGIISSLLSVVYDSLSPAAFEEDWNDMITTYDLWDNAWLNGLYDERKAELEWQAYAKCFSKNTPCVTRYEIEKQVEKMYTIAKFKEFQQELNALMYCDIVDSVGSIYEISESLGQGKKKNFEVAFDETECEVSCICSKFQFRGILCRHALSVLIRHGIEILPEMYILSRWRKDVKRCYSKVKVSYGMQNLSIQQERYDKMCTDFTEVANIAIDDESSYKFVLDLINKIMKDLPKQIRCASVETTAIGEVSCSSNNIEHVINDPITARHKGSPPRLRKQSSLRKKPAQKNKTAEKNKVPVYPFQVGENNIYQPIPYSWHTQPVPPYALQSHYSSPSMTYEGSAISVWLTVSCVIVLVDGFLCYCVGYCVGICLLAFAWNDRTV
ncbi:protein FAR1-RELATED SEQUENCE 6-like [Citrus clementina]|uniref:protein FAR1-RELATED SEQUENCE 6-like n=1 Tax=Citrus clementina TaxID=85681 RepID=UPI000CED781C|nr:protein FAR1-RELATED SEQUENCE 6-like [Citrus x clementina]